MTGEERIADLEIRLAFQDDAMQTLSDVVAEQQRALDLLTAQVRLLARRQAELSERQGGIDDSDVPPPHY